MFHDAVKVQWIQRVAPCAVTLTTVSVSHIDDLDTLATDGIFEAVNLNFEGGFAPFYQSHLLHFADVEAKFSVVLGASEQFAGSGEGEKEPYESRPLHE